MLKPTGRALTILMIGLYCACEQRTEIVLPDDNVLIDLIYDLHLAEASLTRVHAAKQDSVSNLLRQRVAASHGITPEQMDSWLEGLQMSPDHLLIVYDSVIARLEKARPDQ